MNRFITNNNEPHQTSKAGFSLKFGKQPGWVSRVSLFGSLGWAILVPSLLGASLGFWLDTLYPGQIAWISVLLPLGIFLGCLNAGYWFQQGLNAKD